MWREISTDAQREAMRLFRSGFSYLLNAKAGDLDAATHAVVFLMSALEWATPDTCPPEWAEIRFALNEALARRVAP